MRPRSVSGETITLADLLSSFDALALVEAPVGLESAVEDVVIFDREDPASIRRGALVLAVAIPASDDGALALIDLAADADAAAIVFRESERGFGERLRDRAARRRVALLSVAPDMRWDQLLSLIQVALAPSPMVGGGPADLVALADALAVAAGAAVTIEDPRWRVLAYANLDRRIDEARRQTILGRLPPSGWRSQLDAAGVLQRLRSEDAPFRLRLRDAAPRLVAPVRAGGELLGSLWLVEDEEPLGEEAVRALERFAPLAAVHLIAHRAAEHIERRVRSASVRELLDGRRPQSADGGANASVLRVRGPFTVIAFAPDAEAWQGDPARLLSILSLYTESVDAEAMCTILGERLWALVPTPAVAARDTLVDLAERVIAHADRAIGNRLRAGIGVSVPTVGQIPRSRRSAERVLDVIARSDGGAEPVAHADDLRAQILVMEIVALASELPEMRDGFVAQLAAAEPEQLRSLRAYLDAHGDAVAAARVAGVHPNTLRYRIRRLREVYGVDLADPDVRLLACLEARILERAAERD